MKTKQQAAGASLVPPPPEVVEIESKILKEILNETLHERLMEEAMLCNDTPFLTLNKFVVEAIMNRATLKVQAAYSPKTQKPDTPSKLQGRIKGWNPAEMIP